MAVQGERLEAAARSSTGEKAERREKRKESKRMSETPPGTWHGGAQKSSSGSSGSLAEKLKSPVSGVDRSRFPGRRTVREVGKR